MIISTGETFCVTDVSSESNTGTIRITLAKTLRFSHSKFADEIDE